MLSVWMTLYSAFQQLYFWYKKYHKLRCLLPTIHGYYRPLWTREKYFRRLNQHSMADNNCFRNKSIISSSDHRPQDDLDLVVSKLWNRAQQRRTICLARDWTPVAPLCVFGALLETWSCIYVKMPWSDKIGIQKDDSQIEGQRDRLLVQSAEFLNQTCLEELISSIGSWEHASSLKTGCSVWRTFSRCNSSAVKCHAVAVMAQSFSSKRAEQHTAQIW